MTRMPQVFTSHSWPFISIFSSSKTSATIPSSVNLLLVKTPFHNEGDFEVNDELNALVDNISTTENATTFQGVLRHYESHNPDMLCVVRRKRGFFTKIWEKNIILKKDFSSSIPVLVLSGLK